MPHIISELIIENLWWESESAGYFYHGYVTLFKSHFHIELIRLKDGGDLVEPPDDAPDEVKERFEDMQKYYEGAYEGVKIPGLVGKYAMFIFPFAH